MQPEMNKPVKRQAPKKQSETLAEKVAIVEAIEDVNLVRALRQRLKRNPMWYIKATEDGRDFEVEVRGKLG